MNYKIDENIIHDEKSMWDLALTFMSHYNYIKKQIEVSKTEDYFSYQGKIIFKSDKEYKKILSNFKKELNYMNQMLAFKLKMEGNKLENYIEVDS